MSETAFPKTSSESRRAQADKAMLGVRFDRSAEITDTTALSGTKGVLVSGVLFASAGAQAGLVSGDVIFEYDGRNFSGVEDEKIPETFRAYIRDEKKPGEILNLKWFRVETALKKDADENQITPNPAQTLVSWIEGLAPGERLDVSAVRTGRVLDAQARLGRREHLLASEPPKNAELFSRYETAADPAAAQIEKLIARFALRDAYDDVLRRYADDEWWDDGLRLKLLRYVRRDPLKFPFVARDLSGRLAAAAASKSPLAALVAEMPEDAGIEDKFLSILNAPRDADPERHLAYLMLVLGEAQKQAERAFAALSRDDRGFLARLAPQLAASRFETTLGADAPPEVFDERQRFFGLAAKIDFAALHRGAAILARLADPAWLTAFKGALKGSSPFAPAGCAPKRSGAGKGAPADCAQSAPPSITGIKGEILLVKDTPYGRLVVGGAGKNVYGDTAAFIVDADGDDIYRDGAGAVRPGAKSPLALVLDLGGDDTYAATDPVAQGAGLLGLGLLADLEGDDAYAATRLAQGSGLLGAGLLADHAGDDRYDALYFAQGLSLWGLGVLFDGGGDDRYRAHLYAQGAGGPKAGALLADRAGDDEYFASGATPSSYGDEGIFEGFAQGYGFGLREAASGGLGVLFDLGGSDRYEAGNFSQGGGYFFGMGLLADAAQSDDVYIGSHYAQGFAAHSAAGALLDAGGDDSYSGKILAVQGAAWDLSLAMLLDDGGDDLYDAELLDFSQGAAAHNGFALFRDAAGKDIYRQHPGARAQAHTNAYHGGKSLALFIDDGGDADSYEGSETENGRVETRQEHGVFADLPERDADPDKKHSLKKPRRKRR